MEDILLKTDGCIFDVRTVGVLIKNGKILVQRDKGGSEYALPGGHVKLGETTVDGLVREFREETGADIHCERLLWTEECFYELNGKKMHSLAYYYLVKLCGQSDIPDTGKPISHRDNGSVVNERMSIDRIKQVIIYPEFLKETIYNTEGPSEHFISSY